MEDFDLFEDVGGLEAATQTQRVLLDTQSQLGSMLDVMPIGLLIHTEQGVLFSNRAACALLAIGKAEVLGRHLLDYVQAADVETVSAQLSASFRASGETFETETVIEPPEGSQRLVKLISGRLPWDGNPVVQILLQDITEQKRAESSLRRMTITDELTGAYNRRHAAYEAALYISADGGHVPLSVIMMDIDHFKKVNDTYGHGVGDLALQRLTQLVHDYLLTVRSSDSAIFARIGGEEFALLLPGLGTAAAEAVAEKIRRAIEKMRIPIGDATLQFTISLGVAEYEPTDGDFEHLLARADVALYSAKAGGRNAVCRAENTLSLKA